MGAAIGAIIGAGVGVVKQGAKEREQAKVLEAQIAQQRLEPLLNPSGVQRVQTAEAGPSLFNNVLSGGLSGLAFQQANPSLFGGGGSGEFLPGGQEVASRSLQGIGADGNVGTVEQFGAPQGSGLF